MTKTADLLTVLHDIDRMRGRICGSCRYYQRRFGPEIGSCLRGHRPLGHDDGCDDWKEIPTVTMTSTRLLK